MKPGQVRRFVGRRRQRALRAQQVGLEVLELQLKFAAFLAELHPRFVHGLLRGDVRVVLTQKQSLLPRRDQCASSSGVRDFELLHFIDACLPRSLSRQVALSGKFVCFANRRLHSRELRVAVP